MPEAEPNKHDNPEEGLESGVLCPSCLLANSSMAAFCGDCGAPIGMVSTIDPIQSIYAEGFAYRSAVEGTPRLIVVVGMWMLFGPLAVIAPILTFSNASTPDAVDLLQPEGIPLPLFVLGSAVILYRTTKNYVVKSRMARAAVPIEPNDC